MIKLNPLNLDINTIQLLRIIGSPFIPDSYCELPKNKNEAIELYNYALKNKIGLIYLNRLKDKNKLDDFGLELKYEEEQSRYNKQSITLERISMLLNSYDSNYAIIKSIYPFPATPNDIDIIYFGSDDEYNIVMEKICNSNYVEIKGYADSEQRMIHDLRECEHTNKQKKDVYDIDLYKKLSASYIIYIDKEKLRKYITELNKNGYMTKILMSEAELALSIMHSIIPEQLFTLLIYYSSLYYLNQMNSIEIDSFINIVKFNNIVFPVRSHFSLISELHKAAYGFTPGKIYDILSILGENLDEKENLLKNNFKMPHHYSFLTIIKTLAEKTKEKECRKSIIKQMTYMLNPRLAKWVIDNIIWRNARETY